MLLVVAVVLLWRRWPKVMLWLRWAQVIHDHKLIWGLVAVQVKVAVELKVSAVAQ